MNSVWLWSRVWVAINKKQIFLITRPPTCWKLDSSFWFLRKEKKDKNRFVTKFVGIIVKLFSCKNVSQIASETFARQCFFTDHLNHKIVNKTTCRKPSANPHQLWKQLKSFRTVVIIFLAFQDFLIYLAKYFWSLLSSPNLITQQYFTIAM